MNVYQFDSLDDMMAAVAKWNEEANKGLATEQKALTYGDHWVRFYDVGARILDFGKVATEAEISTAEMEAGTDPDEIAHELRQVQARQDVGYLYGRSCSILNRDGEWGSTHKANVWPIEERLYTAAQTVDWEIDRLSPNGRMLLEIAYSCYTTHLRVMGSDRG